MDRIGPARRVPGRPDAPGDPARLHGPHPGRPAIRAGALRGPGLPPLQRGRGGRGRQDPPGPVPDPAGALVLPVRRLSTTALQGAPPRGQSPPLATHQAQARAEAPCPHGLGSFATRGLRGGGKMDGSLATLLTAAGQAPSGDNTQPWRFVVDPDAGTIALEEDRVARPVADERRQRMARIARGGGAGEPDPHGPVSGLGCGAGTTRRDPCRPRPPDPGGRRAAPAGERRGDPRDQPARLRRPARPRRGPRPAVARDAGPGRRRHALDRRRRPAQGTGTADRPRRCRHVRRSLDAPRVPVQGPPRRGPRRARRRGALSPLPWSCPPSTAGPCGP